MNPIPEELGAAKAALRKDAVGVLRVTVIPETL